MAIHFTDKEIALFKVIAKAAATLNTQAFAVGGFVRDKILDRPTKDIDIVCLGDGMQLANEVAKQFNPKPPVALFKTF
ncbi:MAG: tRNA nucleotidyltransferase, partial [Chitinophagia bacterium]|nr:tRNA nucleotidyltransferase [Chitinophagia bacterium]